MWRRSPSEWRGGAMVARSSQPDRDEDPGRYLWPGEPRGTVDTTTEAFKAVVRAMARELESLPRSALVPSDAQLHRWVAEELTGIARRDWAAAHPKDP